MNVSNINKDELRILLALHRRTVRDLEHIEKHQVNCRECVHSNKATPSACHKWNVTPPPEVQAVGCEDWQLDDIPF